MDQAISNNPADLLSILSASVVAVTALLIVISSGSAILRMTAKTNHMVRLIHTTAATGAFAQLVGVVCIGIQVTFMDMLITLGMGVLLTLLDRRTHVGPHPNMPQQDRRGGVHG